MKRIELKKVPMMVYSAKGREPVQSHANSEGVELSYREAIMEILCIKASAQAPVSVDYLRKVVPVLNKLQALADGETLALTDEEHVFIMDRLKGFPLTSPTFLTFYEDVSRGDAKGKK